MIAAREWLAGTTGSVDFGERLGELRRVEPGVGAARPRAARRACPARRSARPPSPGSGRRRGWWRAGARSRSWSGPARSEFIARWISTSVRVSTELVASSRMRMRRLGQERPRDRDQLLLARADVASPRRRSRCRSRPAGCGRSGRRGSPGPPRRSAPASGRPAPYAMFSRDRAAEQPGVLQHHADLLAQLLAASSRRCRRRPA